MNRERSLLIYEMFNLKRATRCVNEPGGSVCRCSGEFNAGVADALQGVVSDVTFESIKTHLQEHYNC